MSDLTITFNDRDEFKRKGVAEKLLTLLESEAPASPVLLEGPWGVGKTEFCHKLVNLGKERSSPLRCIYIDAYKFDHSDDPLLMLMAGISSAIESPVKKKELIKKAIPVAKVLGKVTGKAFVSWALKANADKVAEELADALKDGGEELIDKGIERLVQNLERVEEGLNVYRSALADASRDQKILIILDELDRCRPVFALSVLEKVKHVFGVDGIKFLFSTNISQLCSIVRKQYGSEIDAETYLGKFFNFTVHLPLEYTHDNYRYTRNSFGLFSKFVAESDFKSVCPSDSLVMTLMKELVERDRRSLREIETYCRNLKIYNGVAGEMAVKANTVWLFGALVMVAVYIYTFESELMQQILEDKWTLEDVSKFFMKQPKSLSTVSHDLGTMIYAMFLLELDPPIDSDKLTAEQVKAWDQHIYQSFTAGRGPSKGSRVDHIRLLIRRMQLL